MNLLEETKSTSHQLFNLEPHSDRERLDIEEYPKIKALRRRNKRKMSNAKTITNDKDCSKTKTMKTDTKPFVYVPIDVKEEELIHSTDESGKFLIKERQETKWKVMEYDMLPEWLKDNEFLKSCHRSPTQNYFECFRSIFYLHSETGNIWSHLIGCFVFIIIASYFIATTKGQLYDKLVFLSFFVGAILCLGLSSLFHTVSCHSEDVFQFFRKLDYLGISLLIIGSFIPWIYYGFYCEIVPKICYIVMIVIFGLIVICASWYQIFMEHKYRHIRAIIFVCMGLSGVIPAVHFAISKGVYKLIMEDRFDLLLTMAFLYIFGAVLYATQIPERFFPGKCDIWLQSHQLFHLLVVVAAIIHYIGIYEMATNRLKQNAICTNGTSNEYFY